MIEFIQPFGCTSNYNVRVNNVYCGVLEPKDDGYWDWYPELRPGYIPSWVLRAISDKLDELNKDWDQIVNLQCSSIVT